MGKEMLYWKKGFIETKLKKLRKFEKFCQNCEIWSKLWNLVEILIFGQNSDIWSSFWNFDQIWSKLWNLVKIVIFGWNCSNNSLPALVGNKRAHIGGWMLISYYLPGNRLAPPPGPRANGIPAQAEEEQAIWPFPAWAGTRRRSKQFWSPSRLGGDWEGGGPQWVVCGQNIIRVL